MNGWAKCAGSLSILAGLVYIIAIVLAVNDNISFGDNALAVFINNNNFDKLVLFSGGVLAFGGMYAIASGLKYKNSATPTLGAMQIVAGFVFAITAFDEITNLSAHVIEVLYLISFLMIAAALVVLGVEKKVYNISVAALILAYCVFDLYIIGTYEGMLSVIFGIGIVIFSGIAVMIRSSTTEVVEAEEVESVVAEPEINRAPASAPVAANAPLDRPEPAKEEAKPAPKAAPAPVVTAKAEPVKEEPKPEPVKVEPVPAPVEQPKVAEPVPEVKSEEDILLEQGWKLTVATVGEDKAEEMNDVEIMTVISTADPELYNKLSAITGIVIAKEEPKPEPAPAPVEEPKAEPEPVKEEPKPAPAPVEEPKPVEKSLSDILLEQGWKITVDTVGEERAEEMSDYEIMEVLSVAAPKLYQKLSVLTDIVVETPEEEPEEVEPEEEEIVFDFSYLNLEPDTPEGLMRRACWNKGLRCRLNYGPYYIPVAFVKSKVAVYIDGDTPDHRNDEALENKSWIVLHFTEADITDGQKEAQIVADAVKKNLRALKKKKTKKAKAKE